MRNWKLFSLALLGIAGCKSHPSGYFPIREGAEWTYEVNGRLRNSVEEMRITARTSVDGQPGYVVSGALGSSRIAWKGSKVIASELAGITYTPALVLVDFERRQSEWKGQVRAYGQVHDATDKLSQEPTDFTLSGRKYPAITCSHKLRFGSHTLESKITFVQGLGIGSLEEHREGQFLGSIHYLAGP